MTQRNRDPHAQALLAQRPPADAVSYMPPPGRLSLIIKLVGTDQDRLTRPGDRGLWCYTDRLSYLPGEEVQFHTSTSASRYSIEVARVGARREVLWTKSGIRGALHPTPPEAFGRGCGGPDGFAFRIPRAWRSGYYAVTLRAEDAKDGPLEWDHFFVVIFTRGEGTVFNCGSTEWVYGLQGRDLFVERITRNIFDRLGT